MTFSFIKKLLNVIKAHSDKIIEKIKLALVVEKNLGKIASYKSKPKINSSNVRLSKRTYLGKNCHFNGLRIIGGGKVVIGDNFHSGTDIIIITQNHNYNKGEAIPYDSKRIYKDVIIKDNVWIGSRVTILGGIRIGEGAIIQAGSVVAIDIPKYAIAGGHPAEPFDYRDIKHYEKLKKEGKFH